MISYGKRVALKDQVAAEKAGDYPALIGIAKRFVGNEVGVEWVGTGGLMTWVLHDKLQEA